MIIAGTGHRELPYDSNKLIELTKNKLIENNCTKVLSGMAQGFDTIIALAAIEANIPIESIVPFKGQGANWAPEAKEIYDFIISKASKVIYTSEYYFKECFFVRDRYLVDNADILMSKYDGRKKGGTFYTVNYCTTKTSKLHINLWNDAQKSCLK